MSPIVSVQCEDSEFGDKITIQDNGIGFDPKHLDKIFKPFERLHGAAELKVTEWDWRFVGK